MFPAKPFCLADSPDYSVLMREESERLREMVKGCDMIFIAAGMGKGTGTGASPIVAEIARDLGILTVAVVTRPFAYERRGKIADAGLAELSAHVDSLIVVPNEKLREVMGARGEDERGVFGQQRGFV